MDKRQLTEFRPPVRWWRWKAKTRRMNKTQIHRRTFICTTMLSAMTSAELLSLRQLVQSSNDESFLETVHQAVTDRDGLHPRQREFLELDCEEALYGGAAGGGKTFALIHWLAQGVHIPEYSGIFFRRTYPQLSRSNDSPIAKSHLIYRPLGGVYSAQEHKWTFPSGARIDFSHLQHEDSKFDHQGPSYHRVAFDELTQFTKTQYEYLFSRLRQHVGFPLAIGVRAASNPDGIGRDWVKRRFVTQEAIDSIRTLTAKDPSPKGQKFITPAGRVFMPSRVADNPTLDTEDYIERLNTQLGAVLAARLANGDWSVTEGAQIDPEWLRYFTKRGEHLIPLGKDGSQLGVRHDIQMQRFATVDTAGTSKQKAEEDKGLRAPSWSVCAVWDYWPRTRFLFLRHVWRMRGDFLEVKAGVRETIGQWNVPTTIVENAHHGQPLALELGNCQLVNPVIAGMKTAKAGPAESAKLERAIASGLLKKLQQGEVFFPDVSSVAGVSKWLPDLESELLGWTGRKDETADQIDVCSYAANHVRRSSQPWGGPVAVNVGSRRW